jgi:hypothetical protein
MHLVLDHERASEGGQLSQQNYLSLLRYYLLLYHHRKHPQSDDPEHHADLLFHVALGWDGRASV